MSYSDRIKHPLAVVLQFEIVKTQTRQLDHHLLE